jgi:hypothetical protein
MTTTATQLAAALRLMLEQFTKSPSTLADSEVRVKAHAALAAFEAQAATAAEPVARVAEWQSDVTATIECLPHTGALMKAGDLLYAAPVAQAEPWQPIETAPKDGSEFLLGVWEGEWRNPRKRFTVYHAHGFCNRPVWAANYRTEEGEAYEIAGWMPLPQPPKEGT